MILYLGSNSTFAILLVHRPHQVLNHALTVFETVTVMVADDIRQVSILYVALYAQQVIESLIALGGLGCLVGRQHFGKLSCQHVRIHHFTLGIAWMYADALDVYLRRGSVEVLKLQLTHIAAVHRVSPLAAKLLHIKVMGTHTNFLVGIEGNTYLAVLDFLVLLQVNHRLHYLGNASLVVST